MNSIEKKIKACALITLGLIVALLFWLRLDRIEQRISEIDASMSIVYE